MSSSNGKQIPKLGVLQLKTSFPRPPGDVGNAQSWGNIPVVIRVVEEATGDKVVGGTWGQDLVDAFVREGKKLVEEEGVVAFVTTCGFLATMHPFLVNRLPYIGTTPLLQVAWLQNSFFPGDDSKESVGVITFKKSALTIKHLTSVGAHPETPVYGLPEDTDPEKGVFKAVLESRIPYNFEGMEKEVLAAVHQLTSNHPKVKAIVLECTNIPPFAHSIEKATGLRVYDVLTLGTWLYNGATPRDFRGL
ncbi:uncharacterized protein I303_104121 [Kwoniella dejecticola CBS 10117]|uniref:Aspartate racemase n=1 Tax=Kwoniella dejecticola CBS 10117 TaxID=1296121 RepID=A0A1A6A687_9TREE|nr:uncharacterized protein I303_04900 [Kwoniella dejecticola CBS 10117]OBR85564.1 hypothetical protein I303_04900 [Kwoniella dejecticola CBS 10117]